MSKLPDMRTRAAHEAWCIDRIRRNPLITYWEATANHKRAAAWNHLFEIGVIRPSKKQPKYPYNSFEIHKPFKYPLDEDKPTKPIAAQSS